MNRLVSTGLSRVRRGRASPVIGGVTMALCAIALVAAVAVALPGTAHALKVVSEKTAGGFTFPESVAYDPGEKVLYVSEFGGTEPKAAEKDGLGYLNKVSLDGKILVEHVFPAAGVTMNKPKGIWIQHGKLWVTDIDSVWEFNLKSKQGKRLALPGAQFANDPAILGKTLYVSDNRGDALFSVTPADFLDKKAGEPQVSQVWAGKGINPNGLYPSKDGALWMVGILSDKEPRGIYKMTPGQDPVTIYKDVGRLDGLYAMKDGSLIFTDWNTGSVHHWTAKGEKQVLATGFKGPADLCVFPHGKGLRMVVPDLPKSELRIVDLAM
jgi:sugar lactone lactonase YvrE